MAQFVNDTFTGVDGTGLQSHTGETGATKTKHPSFTRDAAITANRARGDNNTAQSRYTFSGSPADADYDVEAILYWASTVTNDITRVCGRHDTSAVDDASNSPCGTNALVDDPEWVDGTQSLLTMDLSLAATSPTIDWATGVACPATDSAGVKRPQGAACDAGAMERVP